MTDSHFQKVSDLLHQTQETLHIPGAALGIYHDGEQWSAGFGVTSIENPLPVTPDTLFQIGSITKTYVGTLIMRLLADGRLELDTPVKHYLPDLKLQDAGVAEQVTPRHLLTHVGGWVGEYFDDFGDGDDALLRIVEKSAELAQVLPLGAAWSYNNVGFYIVGRLIEVITGRVFEDAIHHYILRPLGLEHTLFKLADVMLHRFAVGHEVIDGKPVIARPYPMPRACNPTGGLVSSVNDQLRYARFHLYGQPAILSREWLEQMRQPQVEVGGYIEAMGISWLLNRYGEYLGAGHTGGTNGQISELVLLPEQDFALIVVTNGGNGAILNRVVIKAAMREYFGIELTMPPAITVPINEYTGSYTSYGRDIRLYAENGILMADTFLKGKFPTPDTPPPAVQAPPMPLVFYAPDKYFVPDGAYAEMKGEFLRDASGRVYGIRFGGRVHVRAD